MRIVLLSIFFLLLNVSLFSQSTNSLVPDSSINNIRETLRTKKQRGIPQEGEAFNFKYFIITEFRDGTPTNTEYAEYEIDYEFTHYKGSKGEYYQDKNNIVLVVDSERTIYLNFSTLDYYKNKDYSITSNIVDSILSPEKITGYKVYVNKKMHTIEKFTLIDKESYPNIERTVYYYNNNLRLFEKTEIYYTINTKMRKQTVEVLSENYNYKSFSHKKNAINYVFDMYGNLYDKYKGYEVLDVRD